MSMFNSRNFEGKEKYTVGKVIEIPKQNSEEMIVQVVKIQILVNSPIDAWMLQ